MHLNKQQQQIFREIRNIICEALEKDPRSVWVDTRLQEDLGLEGDALEEFMQTYAEALRVDISQFRMADYAKENNAIDLGYLSFLMSLFGNAKYVRPLTVKLLVQAAERGKFSPVLY